MLLILRLAQHGQIDCSSTPMRLVTTGAFVRAAHSARLSGERWIAPGPVTAISTTTTKIATRWTATFAAASKDQESLPEQPIGREIDRQNQTAPPAVADGPRARFRQALQEQQENKIVRRNGLSGAKLGSSAYVFDETSNLSPSILNLLGRNLYDTPNHPICTTRTLVESVFGQPEYKNHVARNPIVTTRDNFDVLGFPPDHPGRSRTDTYYVDSTHVLRTHTSAHQHQAFQYMTKHPEVGYTICADVYRRDSIDRSHFPVFHQMEGARLWKRERDRYKSRTRLEEEEYRRAQMKKDLEKLPRHDLEVIDEIGSFNLKTNPPQLEHDPEDVKIVAMHLKRSLENLVAKVFTAAKEAGVGGENATEEKVKIRWVEAYFPFTSPSFELEVFWQGDWLELLGCGVVQQPILNNAGLKDRIGWAWGLGVERLAMLLYGVPDIRLFWSTDERFLSQFESGKVRKFEPFSKYPACYKDVAFWIHAAPPASPLHADAGAAIAAGGDSRKASPAETLPAAFHENDVMEIVRDVAGTLAEDVKLVDEFVHPKTGRKSLCYRINYRSLERTLTNEEVNKMHDEVTARLARDLGIELR